MHGRGGGGRGGKLLNTYDFPRRKPGKELSYAARGHCVCHAATEASKPSRLAAADYRSDGSNDS